MDSEQTVTMTRHVYDALIERNSQLEDMLAAQEAEADARVPHEIALDIMRGKSPIQAFRNHRGMTLRQLSDAAGVAPGDISEIERGLKPGSVSALARIAEALGTTVDALLIE